MTETLAKKSKLSRLSATIRQRDRQLKAEAMQSWRRWAQQVADGGECPAAREVIEVAAILGIDNAAANLQADADAIAQYDQAQQNAAMCRKTVASKLVPFGGSAEKLAAAVEAAKAEHARLAAILDEVQSGCSESFWTSHAHRLSTTHPRIWPGATPPAAVHDDHDDAEVVE